MMSTLLLVVCWLMLCNTPSWSWRQQQPHRAAPCTHHKYHLHHATTSYIAVTGRSSRPLGNIPMGKMPLAMSPSSIAGQVSTEARLQEVQALLSTLQDPSTLQPLDLALVQSIDITQTGDVKVSIKYPAGKTAASEDLKKLALLQLSSLLAWANKVDVSILAMSPNVDSLSDLQNPVRATIKHVIAVSSCKGGVGKSTTAVNLAYTLKAQGYRVGILDADIYGPSLPTMTKAEITAPIVQGQSFIPPEYNGVKLMSMGYLNRGAAIMRGPMVNQVLNQLVTLTKWGDLDYLILDMPPGTGDIQLTLAQVMNISAAVIVTTPQRLSFVDVVKGIDMFDTVNVPSIAVVENMASYMTYDFPSSFFDELAAKVIQSSSNSETLSMELKRSIESHKVQRRIFGEGHNQKLKSMWGIENVLSIPLTENLATCGDKGMPFVEQFPQSDVAQMYQQLAHNVVTEIDRLSATSKDGISTVSYDEKTHKVLLNNGDKGAIDSKSLRCDCKCAVCVEELTGRKMLNDESISNSVRPRAMAPIGRYAWSIDWSDGHKSLYPFKQLAAIAQQ